MIFSFQMSSPFPERNSACLSTPAAMKDLHFERQEFLEGVTSSWSGRFFKAGNNSSVAIRMRGSEDNVVLLLALCE